MPSPVPVTADTVTVAQSAWVYLAPVLATAVGAAIQALSAWLQHYLNTLTQQSTARVIANGSGKLPAAPDVAPPAAPVQPGPPAA